MLSRGDSHLITLPSAAEGELLLGIHWVCSLRAVLLFNAELHGGLCGVLLTDEFSELLEIFSVSGGNLWKEVGFTGKVDDVIIGSSIVGKGDSGGNDLLVFLILQD